MDLHPAETRDLIAAVVGAHTWLAALRLASFTAIPDAGSGAALAAIFCRAAGSGAIVDGSRIERARRLDEWLNQTCRELPDGVMRKISDATRWAGAQPGRDDALLLAAEDLAAAGPNTALAAAARLLLAAHHAQQFGGDLEHQRAE